MSKRIRGSLPYLQLLAKSSPKLRKLLIDNAPSIVITALCECCLNVLKGVVPSTPHQKRRLARYKAHLRALANKKVSRKKKKRYLNRKGGSLLTASFTSSCFGGVDQFVEMKRMALVPEEVLNRYEQRQRLGTSPIMADMIQKDTQMSDILRRDDMTDDQKQKLYNANLERYLELRQQKDSQIPSVRVVGKKEQQPPQPQQQQLADAAIVEFIPKTMQERATALLNRLKTRADLITWDKSGQVKIKGETIPDSNISDLVSDAMRSRKGFKSRFVHCQCEWCFQIPHNTRDLLQRLAHWRTECRLPSFRVGSC